MDFISKSQNTCNEDRISRLPGSVLNHILSFLPTKSAVATSVLSCDWKDQWRSVTNLDFDETLFIDPVFDPNHKPMFMDFIDQVMTNRDNSLNIDKFSVCCRLHCDKNRLNKCMDLAIKQNVKEMILDLNIWECLLLPKSTFVCETLAILKLHNNICVHAVHSAISLPSLKILHFYNLRFSKYESVETIVKGCPLLEELIIMNCKWIRGSVLRITGLPFLKKLTISMCGICLSQSENELVVDVPSLEYLELQDSMFEKFTMLNLGSLVDAKIDVFYKISQFVSVNEYGNRVFTLLQGISNIRSLSLCPGTMKTLIEAHENNFPTFPNLTRLECVDIWSRFSVLPKILTSSPILETLVLSKDVSPYDIFQLVLPEFNWNPPKAVPNCLLLHLKEIEIKDFRGTHHELILIEYFLENALVLERIFIDYNLVHKDNNVMEKLENFGRRSRNCCVRLIFDP